MPYYRWLKYREGYSGELVKEIIRRFPINNDAFIIDPMCGSGSTLVACKEINIHSYGFDVNPFAVLATNVKCENYNNTDIDTIKLEYEKIIKFTKYNKLTHNEYDIEVSKYFNEEYLNELVFFKRKVMSIRNTKIKDFFTLVLLSIIEDCSNRKKDGNGLATRPTKVTSIRERFTKQYDLMLYDILNYPLNFNISCKAYNESAINIFEFMSSIKSSSNIESIIFSPPYANSFDYFESYKMELLFGEFYTYDGLNKQRKKLIRNFRITKPSDNIDYNEIVELLSNEITQRIPEKEKRTGVRDGRTRLVPNMLSAYFHDMKEVLINGYNSLSEHGKMHIIVDQSSYIGVPIPTDIIFGIISEELGFKKIEITKCRRANTSGQQLKAFPYLKLLLRETIVTLHK